MKRAYKLSVRIDEETKEQAAKIYDKLGIDISTAVRIFIYKSIEANGLPFDMTLPKK